MQIVGGGEQHRYQVVVFEVVALHHRLQQLDGALAHVFAFIDVKGGGPAQASHHG